MNVPMLARAMHLALLICYFWDSAIERAWSRWTRRDSLCLLREIRQIVASHRWQEGDGAQGPV